MLRFAHFGHLQSVLESVKMHVDSILCLRDALGASERCARMQQHSGQFMKAVKSGSGLCWSFSGSYSCAANDA